MAGSSHPKTAPDSSPARTGHIDHRGRYHDRGKISAWNVGAYVVLLIVILVIFREGSVQFWVPYALIALVLFLLVRYLSTRYMIDDQYLHAQRLLGGRRMALEDVRQIDYASIRDLSPIGFFGSWGWRGRMWSPRIGSFDSIYTDTFGLLVSPADYPLFFSPSDPAGFARELSRRVRSFSGPLAVDVGDPSAASAAIVPSF
ncbi:MAG: hypothetical protein L3K02_08535 [Thermoplasmata archaeon]|nr:hypothetical protein [Thermoplasmata archaeon]